jgi:hypothetical protein
MEALQYFFSYARKDAAFVLRLAKELREVGINLWLDQLDILGGQHWDHAVEEALQTCQGMIAVLSPDALASHNVMDEISYALEERKIVIPILLHSCTVPFRLRRLQYIDFTADYQTGFAQLLRALRIDQPSQPRAPAVPEETVVQDITAPSKEHSETSLPIQPLSSEQQIFTTKQTRDLEGIGRSDDSCTHSGKEIYTNVRFQGVSRLIKRLSTISVVKLLVFTFVFPSMLFLLHYFSLVTFDNRFETYHDKSSDPLYLIVVAISALLLPLCLWVLRFFVSYPWAHALLFVALSSNIWPIIILPLIWLEILRYTHVDPLEISEGMIITTVVATAISAVYVLISSLIHASTSHTK